MESDQRIRLVTNDRFLTQVENYNHALRQISQESKYCKIVQADDWIFPNCLEEMVGAAEVAANVALVGSYSLYDPLPNYGERPYLGHAGLPYSCRLMSGNEALRRYLMDYLCLFGSPTCVMFRTRDVLAQRDFFHLNSPVEDIEACFDVLQNGDFAFVHQVLTFNRREEGSFWWKISAWNADALNKLILTRRYGEVLFSDAELSALLNRVRGEYYRSLSEGVLEFRGPEFWRFHADGLASVGDRIETNRLLWYLLIVLLEHLANPKATVGRILRALKTKA